MIEAEWDDERRGGGLLQPRAATTCLSDEELEEFLFNRLSGYTREVVEEHLLYCHSCLDRIEQEEGLVGVLRDACSGVEAEDLEQVGKARERRHWRRLLRWPEISMPALAMALAGLAILLIPVGRFTVSGPAVVALHAERGSALGGGREAPAGRPLTLQADLTGVPVLDRYVMSLVDSNGRLVEEHLVVAEQSTTATAGFQPRGKGQYWVRLYSPDRTRDLLREYSILIR